MLKEELPKTGHGFFYLFGHLNLRLFHTVDDHIVNHRIQSASCCSAEKLCIFLRQILRLKNTSSDRIIDIMVNVSNLIRESYNLSFQRTWLPAGLMVLNPVQHLQRKI